MAKYTEMTPDLVDAFIGSFRAMCEIIHANAVDKGFWDGERNFGESLALVHSEVSEALEAHRNGDGYDDKLPEMRGVTVELADVIIRIMDIAGNENMQLGEAILKKTQYNQQREKLHGKRY